MQFYDNYGMGYQPLFEDPLFSDKEKEQMQARRLRKVSPISALEDPSRFDVPDLSALLGGTAPTGINPAAPASTQPPPVGVPSVATQPTAVTSPAKAIAPTVISTAPAPNKYQRMEGVTLDDRMQSLAMTMSAVGTPQFNDVYTKANQLLLAKQQSAQNHNMALDEGTQPTVEVLSNGTTVTRAPKYIRNSDNTYSINPKAGSVTGTQSSSPGLSGLTPEQRAVIENATGDNGDTMLGYFLGQNAGIIPKDMTFEQFTTSPLNANQGETSKSFNRNTGVFVDQGYTRDQAEALSMLAENGGLQIVSNKDTGEIKAIDPVTQESFVIEDYETGLQKLVGAQSNLQSSEDELGQYDSIVTQSRDLLDTNDKSYGEQRRGIRVLDRWEEKINGMSDKEFDDIFGWGNQLMYDFFGKGHPTLAALNSVTTYEGLQTLANEANLAPVSNMEFTKVAGLLGSGKIESKDQLLALFEEARFRTDDKIQRIIRENEYHLKRLQQVPNKTWYNMYSERPYMTEAQTLEEAQK
jgi:hypothetical protein